MIRIGIPNEFKRRVPGIPLTKMRSVLEVAKDAFDCMKMRLFWISLIASTHAGGKHDVRATGSEVQQGANHSSI